jgi:predicted GIY-YIG superfamily endonuclease
MIKIDIPEFIIINPDTLKSIPYDVGGVYCIYNNENELLYVGKAKELKQRLQSHFSGESVDSNTSRINHLFKYANIFFEECPLNREIYETYIINTFKPLYNKQKCILYKSKFYNLPRFPKKPNKQNLKNRCISITNQGEQCRCIALKNSDKCRFHNKITD